MLTFDPPLIEGRFITRYKRFFSEISCESETVLAHCANTGRMTGLLVPGARVWIRRQPPGRQLKYAWELVEIDGEQACVNTVRANQILASTEVDIWMPGTTWVRREPRVGSHRFDALLDRDGNRVFIEAKSVTLCEQGVGYFPDAPSVRAIEHLNRLIELASQGVEVHLIFMAMHTGIRHIEPAREISPEFAECCRAATAAGVSIGGFAVDIAPEQLCLGARVPVSV
jgi:sugar fermentation stimulation protein A